MDNAVIRYVFDKKKVATNSTVMGLLQVEVRVKNTNQCVYISTGIKLYKNQFSSTNGFTCKNSPNSVAITGKARRIFSQIESFVLSNDCKSLKEVKLWDSSSPKADSFIDFIKRELLKKDISYETAKHHRVIINKLEEFGQIKTFADLTYKNIIDFDSFLRKTVKASSSLNKKHSILKHYIKEAINMNLLVKDPYVTFKMPSSRSKYPVFLEQSEIDQIIVYSPINERLQKVKDLFIF